MTYCYWELIRNRPEIHVLQPLKGQLDSSLARRQEPFSQLSAGPRILINSVRQSGASPVQRSGPSRYGSLMQANGMDQIGVPTSITFDAGPRIARQVTCVYHPRLFCPFNTYTPCVPEVYTEGEARVWKFDLSKTT